MEIKLIVTIQERCRECKGTGYPADARNNCKSCKGTGEQEAKIYDLRDFEKCEATLDNPPENWHCIDGNKCTGYIIPKEYKPYEIRKVSEIIQDSFIGFNNSLKLKHNLKEEDKLVVRRR